jgi:predicted alpha/beta-hydrolase family hydrolase
VALAAALAESGIAVLRCDLPFRQVRSFGPPRPGDAARDRQGLVNAVVVMKEQFPGDIYLGGHSYGGRQGSMVAAENPHRVSGLLLSSYPLHPPGNPARMRTEHFPKLKVPALFVQGTRDPFGSIKQIEAARKLIPAKTELLVVEGVGHDLGHSRKIAPNARDLPMRVLKSFMNFLEVSAR